MSGNSTDIAIATFSDHERAASAVKALQRAGFNMKRISIVGKDYEVQEHVIGYLNAGDRAKIFGKYGAYWGGLMGILFGSAMLFVPVFGHLIILGPLAAALFGGLESAVVVGGVSALVGALTAIGIPKDSVLRYETALKANKFLLVVHGEAGEIERARGLLKNSGLESYDTVRSQADAAATPQSEAHTA